MIRIADRLLPLALVACSAPRPWGRATIAEPTNRLRTIEIAATRNAFTPSHLVVNVEDVVRLRFTRTTSRSCAREVIISLDGDRRIRRELTVGVPVEITLRFERAGELGFSCGMAMLGGTIDVRETGR